MTRAAASDWLVRLLVAAGLGVDAGIHAYLAPSQPPGGDISQTSLFYLEAAVAAVAAVLVLVAASRAAYVLAFLVAISALGAVLLYRYVDVGPLGPLPDMYEPFWELSKGAAAVAEAVAAAAAAGAVLTRHSRPRARAGRELDSAPGVPS